MFEYVSTEGEVISADDVREILTGANPQQVGAMEWTSRNGVTTLTLWRRSAGVNPEGDLYLTNFIRRAC